MNGKGSSKQSFNQNYDWWDYNYCDLLYIFNGLYYTKVHPHSTGGLLQLLYKVACGSALVGNNVNQFIHQAIISLNVWNQRLTIIRSCSVLFSAIIISLNNLWVWQTNRYLVLSPASVRMSLMPDGCGQKCKLNFEFKTSLIFHEAIVICNVLVQYVLLSWSHCSLCSTANPDITYSFWKSLSCFSIP